MKKMLVYFSLCSVLYAMSGCNNNAGQDQAETPALDSTQLVERGKYLVNTIGCDDCHSPKKMGAQGPEIEPSLRFSGYPADRPLPPVSEAVLQDGWSLFGPELTVAIGPWGASFAANITSDSTGIGNWTKEQFVTAMREGKSKGLEGGRPILPPMPWQNFRNMTDEDLRAIWAFLQTTTPVKNVVPSPVPLSEIKYKK